MKRRDLLLLLALIVVAWFLFILVFILFKEIGEWAVDWLLNEQVAG